MPFNRLELTLTLTAFYIGSIIGTHIVQYWLQDGDKRKIYGVSFTLFVLSCIPYMINTNEFYWLLIARLLAGVAHSLNYITAVVHISEVAVKELRGMLVSFLSCFIKISVYTSYILTATITNDPTTLNQTTFGLGLMYAFLAIPFVFCLFYDSPLLLIKHGEEQEAIRTMMRLRNESTETWEIRNDFQEMKTMIEEDVKLNQNILHDGNLRPLILITLSSLVSVLSFNFPINYICIHLTFLQSTVDVQPTAVIYLILITTIGFFLLMAIDKFRRHAIQGFTGFASGALLILSGIFVLCVDSIEAQIAVFSIYQVFAVLVNGAITDVLTSEAFPLTKKINSIVFRFDFENILHIILISTTTGVLFTETFMTTILMVTGALIIIISIFLWKKIPETRLMSLRQARAEFRQMGDILYSGNNKPTGIIHS